MKKTVKTATEAITAALKYIVHNVKMRAELQELKGVGLNACAAYVSRHVTEQSIEAAAEYAAGKQEWRTTGGQMVLLVSGNKGTTARFCDLSKCGKFALVIGEKGGKGIVSIGDLFGDKGTAEVLTLAEFAKRIAKNEQVRFTRTKGGQVFHGRLVGKVNDGSDVCGLAFGTKEGRLHIADIETDANNAHNILVRGHLGGTADADAHSLTDAAIATASKGGARVAGVIKAKVKVRAKKAAKA